VRWSIPEILHAGAILAQYHSLCSLIFGQGIKEYDVDIAMTFEKEQIQPVFAHQASLHEEEKTISFLIKQKSTSSEAAPTTPSKNDGRSRSEESDDQEGSEE
jgi:hypothetical protein